MTGVPSDYTIIGTVLAISMAIILLSGLALYISFRVRETLRDEKGRGARAAKVGFLIGLLFLSGGVFYFFASGFNAVSGTVTSTTSSISTLTTSTSQSSASSTASSTGSGTSTIISTTSTSQSISSTSTTTSVTSTTSTTSTSSTGGQSVSMNVQCPTSGGSVTAGSTFSCSVTVYNVGSSTYQSAALVSSGDFTQFAFQSCSETLNGNPESCTVVSSTEISAGGIAPGTTVLTLGVVAPTSAGQKACTLTLSAPGLGQTVTQTFTIQVTNRP